MSFANKYQGALQNVTLKSSISLQMNTSRITRIITLTLGKIHWLHNATGHPKNPTTTPEPLNKELSRLCTTESKRISVTKATEVCFCTSLC